MAETSDNSQNLRDGKKYDFAFILRPASLLKTAIDALSDRNINPDNEVLIQVTPNGCEISVWHVDMKTGHELFVFLRLKANDLEGFQCDKPLRKMLPLTGISRVLRASDRFLPESVAIFLEDGSDRISFQWGTSPLDFALGRPVHIDLARAEENYEVFPNVGYIYETVVPSEDLPEMMTKLPDDYLINGAKCVEMRLRAETVDDNKRSSKQQYTIQMEWSCWESLENASRIAENCSVYLINDPDKFVMLSFKIDGVGEMVYLNEVDFIGVPELPCKGRFHSLHSQDSSVTDYEMQCNSA